uniref:DNA-directed DNA polymerase n=1 Tax=viral metagenome TaxID=1070528 RepID=A0A6C0LVE1_9ZZZZ
MKVSSNNCIFPYHWNVDEKERDVTCIRVYGIDVNNKTSCLRIDDFTPYVYIELPTNIEWTPSKAQLVGNKIDEILGNKRPIKKVLMNKKKLYGAHINTHDGSRKLFPFLFCSFSNENDAKALGYRLRNSIHVVGCGAIKLKIHEGDASPVLQLTCCRNISTAGWVKFSGKEQLGEDKLTLCDTEYVVKWKHLAPHDSDILPKPRIMGFDIEVNSHNPSKFPDAKEPGDKVFQISCVMSNDGDHPSDYVPFLLTLGDPNQDEVGVDVNIIRYKTESNLLEGFAELIRTEAPNIISGYNILGFDIPYLIDRAKLNMVISEFDRQGFHKYNHAPERTIKWSSSAFKNQEFQFLDAEGRLYVDLLPLVRNNYKMNNYKLKTVAEHFIGETKDPLSVAGIFKCYRLGMIKEPDGSYGEIARKAMSICGKYCVQDSVLVLQLMDKLKIWPGLTEMAKTCQVPIFNLYTKGQQIRVYSQVYKFCMTQNIVVEKDGYVTSEAERYVGAHVFPPIPGRYEKVVPFDFASLYPTTIIAYNIDYHTFVTDPSIPDDMCHVMEWKDCIGCCHDPKVIRVKQLTEYITTEQERIKKLRDKRNKSKGASAKSIVADEIAKAVADLKPYTTERSDINKSKPKFPMCEVRKYRFLKEPKGVIPTVLQNLLDARKNTRKVDMKACLDELKTGVTDERRKELNSLLDVLDKRQLAYKVSCNSMYGAMGVRRGYLPFMPGAMCTTYMGRVNIEKVAKVIPEKFGGELIYGDTDSNYIHFPHLKTAHETWDHALHVAAELTKLFPSPIVLEFEEEIYDFFFILTKKRYMYRKCLRDGVVDDKIGKKGVLLARRDNSKFVRDVYEGVISLIADNNTKECVIDYVLGEINQMCSNQKPISDFVVTKAVGDCGNLDPVEFYNEKGVKKSKVGDYTVPCLPSRTKYQVEWQAELDKKGAVSAKEFYLLCLPAQVQLAERMRRRGQRVDNGTRLEYVISNPECHTAKQYEKVECVDYLRNHIDVLSIDYLYYIKALANPLDQVLTVAFEGVNDFVLDQYIFRYKYRSKVLHEIRDLFKHKLKFVN